METSTIESKYQELLFLNQDIKDPKLKFILLIHAINLFEGLNCTGLQENDPESDYVLPPDWSRDNDGVYSFRYFDRTQKDTIYLKFVIDGVSVDINAVTASKNDKIVSTEFKLSDYSEFDSKTIEQISKKYRTEFLRKLLPHLKPITETKVEILPNINRPEDDRGFLWTIPRNDHQQQNPFGDYGRSDLFPVSNNPIDIDSRGNLLGPRNPIFNGGIPAHRPHIRYDPTGPGDIDPTNPDPDLNFFPKNPFDKKDPRGGPFGGPGGFGGGGFGGGYGGGFGGGGFI